jgi:predicted Zn-dependent protease
MSRRRGAGAAMASMVIALALFAGSPGARADDSKKDKKGGNGFLDYFDPRAPDRDRARKYAPGELEDMTQGRRATGKERPLRLRIYADEDFRGATMRWQKRVLAQVDRINQVVGPVFNVRFEIESLRKWDKSHVGLAFDPIIAELERLDAGEDVDWVMGFVTSFRGVATSIHQIGGAALVSKHFVMRGMDDQEEARNFEEAFKLLPGSEREGLYEARKAHKEVVIFLHEWAHTLGALHAEDPEYVMNPRYDAKQAAFTDFERRLVLLALDKRLADRSKPYPEAAELLKLVEHAPEGEGSTAERESLKAILAARAQGGPVGVGGGTPGPNTLAVGADDVATYNRAVGAINAGHRDEAWQTAAPLFAKHPRDARVLALACTMCAGHARASEARATCDAAIALAPRELKPLVDASAQLARAGKPLEAAPYVAAAAKLLEGGADDAMLVRLAAVAGSIGALSVAEAALARVGQRDAGKELPGEIETTRKRAGLPRDAARLGVPPESEPAYLDAYWSLSRDVDARASDAGERVAAFAQKFPDAPAPKVLACSRELRAGHLAAAGKQCQAAVSAYPEAVRAHLLLGVIAAQGGRYPDAEKAFRRAVLLDPNDPANWRELGRFYKATHAAQKLSQLSQEHETLLGGPLPR